MCSKECLISSIEMLRTIAWEHAIKYRFDPVLGNAHEKYLNNLNALLDHASEKGGKDE